MPIFNPFALLIVAPFAAAIIWILAALPAYPANRWCKLLWAALLFLLCGSLVHRQLYPDPMVFWTAPPVARAVTTALLLLPFAVSFLLWRRRRAVGTAVSAAFSTVTIIVVCVIAIMAVSVFNGTCVYHRMWHDDGTAWCPATWQATLG